MSNQSKKATGAKSESKSKNSADAITKEDVTSKTTTDKAATEVLAAPTKGGGSISTAITQANNASKSDVAPEVVEAAEAVYKADEQRAATQINNANMVNDAKTLVQRRKEEGLLTEEDRVAGERVASDQAAQLEENAKLPQENVMSQADANARAQQLLATPYTGKTDKTTQIGIVEGEQGARFRHTVTQTADGRVSQSLDPHEGEATKTTK